MTGLLDDTYLKHQSVIGVQLKCLQVALIVSTSHHVSGQHFCFVFETDVSNYMLVPKTGNLKGSFLWLISNSMQILRRFPNVSQLNFHAILKLHNLCS
jgi:hypothetical protein